MTGFKTWLLGVAAWLAVSLPALAQEAETKSEPIAPALNLITLGLVLAIAIGVFMYFLRKRSNREATERGLGMDDDTPRR